MSPIRKETITTAFVFEKSIRDRRVYREKIIAEGDIQDPGLWMHYTNAWGRGARLSISAGEKRGDKMILDVPVKHGTGEIIYKAPKNVPRRTGRDGLTVIVEAQQLHGVWKQIEEGQVEGRF